MGRRKPLKPHQRARIAQREREARFEQGAQAMESDLTSGVHPARVFVPRFRGEPTMKMRQIFAVYRDSFKAAGFETIDELDIESGRRFNVEEEEQTRREFESTPFREA